MPIQISKGIIIVGLVGTQGETMTEMWEIGEAVQAQTFKEIITQRLLPITEIRMGEIMEVIITGTVVPREVQIGIGGPEGILKGTSIPGGIRTGTKGLGTIMGIEGVKLQIITKTSADDGVGIKGDAIVTHMRQEGHHTGEITGDKDIIMDIDRETRTGGTKARCFHQAG